MKKDALNNIVEEFVPQKLITLQEAADLFNKKHKAAKKTMSVRTLKYYASEGILDKPIILSNKGYYPEDYIMPELDAVYVLKATFGCGIDSLKKLAENKNAYLHVTVNHLYKLLSHYAEKDDFKVRARKNMSLGMKLANDKKLQFVAESFLGKVTENASPFSLQANKHKRKVFDKELAAHDFDADTSGD